MRSQIETIKHFEFQDDPAEYPTIEGLPDGTTITFEVTDAAVSYTRPQPDGTVIDGVIQKITITGAVIGTERDGNEHDIETSITFYKLDTR